MTKWKMAGESQGLYNYSSSKIAAARKSMKNQNAPLANVVAWLKAGGEEILAQQQAEQGLREQSLQAAESTAAATGMTESLSRLDRALMARGLRKTSENVDELLQQVFSKDEIKELSQKARGAEDGEAVLNEMLEAKTQRMLSEISTMAVPETWKNATPQRAQEMRKQKSAVTEALRGLGE